MRVVVIGSGTIGSAVGKMLKEHGHEVASVGRKSGAHQADISDMASLKTLFANIGPFDAVANAAGDVFPGPFEELTDEQWAKSIAGKGMGQINLVSAALPHIADKGSFTLISGVLTDEYMRGGTIGTTINHMVEGFVKAAAVELPRGVRINCVSPLFWQSRSPITLISPASRPCRLRKSRSPIFGQSRTRSPGAF